jgi:hypothetical protein
MKIYPLGTIDEHFHDLIRLCFAPGPIDNQFVHVIGFIQYQIEVVEAAENQAH